MNALAVSVCCALVACCSCAAVSGVQNETVSVMEAIDLTSSALKTLATNAPAFSPVLTFGAVSYVAYVALQMAMPTTMKLAGLPLLDEASEARSMKPSTDAMDILTAVLLKEVVARSAVADELLSIGRSVVDNGMAVIKIITNALYKHVDSARDVLKKIVTAARPECLARSLCEIGQITRENFPAVVFLLRTVDSPDLDEFSQALIDGTTIGDCTSVYYECDDL